MDYSNYKQIEFRRKYWQFIGVKIFMTDKLSGQEIGFVQLKGFRMRNGVTMYTDRQSQQPVITIKPRKAMQFNRLYDIFDSSTNQLVFSMQRNALRSAFSRDHWTIADPNGAVFGSVQETSPLLAVMRRWIELVPYIGPLISIGLSFTAQTFDLQYATNQGESLIAGKLVHRKSPVVVRMDLDTTMAQVNYDPRIGIASAALLAILDVAKRD
jgi:hypothetical protein